MSDGAAEPRGAASHPGSGQSFSKARRLLDPAEFDAVFAARRSLRSQHLNLHFAHNSQGHARLGIVVGKRQLRRAVQRNRFKRVAREAFRMRAAALPALDVVLRLAKPLARVDCRALRAEIDTLLARAASHPQ